MALGYGLSIPRERLMRYAFGPNLLLNGGFTSDSVWVKGLGWTISGGRANINGLGLPSTLSQPLAAGLGLYQVDIEVASVASPGVSVGFTLLGVPIYSIFVITSPGTYSSLVLMVASSDAIAVTATGGAQASIESISVRRVL